MCQLSVAICAKSRITQHVRDPWGIFFREKKGKDTVSLSFCHWFLPSIFGHLDNGYAARSRYSFHDEDFSGSLKEF
jgi:hypothetical protein